MGISGNSQKRLVVCVRACVLMTPNFLTPWYCFKITKLKKKLFLFNNTNICHMFVEK